MIHVYISEVGGKNTVLPPYTNCIKNEKALAERHSAYSLLYRGAKELFGITVDPNKISRNENGKPTYPGFDFSLSHSNGVCAVAISDDDVGVDIEKRISPDRENRIGKYIRHPLDTECDTTLLWTQKEAVFKLISEKAFIPSKINVSNFFLESKAFYDFTVTVAAYDKTEIIWHMP